MHDWLASLLLGHRDVGLMLIAVLAFGGTHLEYRAIRRTDLAMAQYALFTVAAAAIVLLSPADEPFPWLFAASVVLSCAVAVKATLATGHSDRQRRQGINILK